MPAVDQHTYKRGCLDFLDASPEFVERKSLHALELMIKQGKVALISQARGLLVAAAGPKNVDGKLPDECLAVLGFQWDPERKQWSFHEPDANA